VQEKPPKNSSNSSISPSSEIAPLKKRNTKNQSLREKSNKNVGGQIGREGITLLQSDTPDEIVTLPYSFAKNAPNGPPIAILSGHPCRLISGQ
jgi:hypothetical protein